MHKKLLFPLALLWSVMSSAFAGDWEPAAHTLLTPWGKAVSPSQVWQQYPRPQMVRNEWINLNGLWDFAITDRMSRQPESWESQILVPFAVETPLSGIGKRLQEQESMWYRKSWRLDALPTQRMLLHFEGVDYACMVWLNGELVGSHKGGLLPFSFEISSHLKTGENELVLRAIDDTDLPDHYQLRGKQKRNNNGIWYTPSSGIWQTVWLEPVPASYLARIKTTADMNGKLCVQAEIGGHSDGHEHLRVTLLEAGKPIVAKTGITGNTTLHYAEATLWSPNQPKLYDLQVELLDASGAVLDTVQSYVGFRTVDKRRDAQGHWRFTLNGDFIFHLGPLDQGWWPGSFLNPPADEAIVYEMQFLKAAGFNMIRKHKKVEPRRYYYHADQIGLLVWQDQVSGGTESDEWPIWKKLKADSEGYEARFGDWWTTPGQKLDADWPDWAHAQYMSELKTMIDTLYNHPCVVVWTTFNERWGQHRSLEVGQWVEQYDPTRLLNIASGGNFFEVGDIADEHDYPDPSYPLENPLFDNYIKVVGEFGGHGLPVEGHLWNPDMHNWGYGGLPKNKEEYRERYIRTANLLGKLRQQGIAAGVYTQTTDVEGELNGLMTYDRSVLKLEAADLHEIHQQAGLLD